MEGEVLISIGYSMRGYRLDFVDGMLPFHRWTNGGQPSKNHRYQWLADPKPSKNHRFQWLPLTILFNGDGASEKHCKFSMAAKTGCKSPTTTTTNFRSEKRIIQLDSPQKKLKTKYGLGCLKV